MTATLLAGAVCRLRPYRTSDAQALRVNADDPEVARWMGSARFPSPYTLDDARAWIVASVAADAPHDFAIEVDGAHAGGIGLMPRHDELRGSAAIGYWLGRAFWGRGIATDAVRTLAGHALGAMGFRRLDATVFAPNIASSRVLEKCGFSLEGRLRDAYVQRDGAICDGLLYARLAWDPKPGPPAPKLAAPPS